MIVKKTPRGRVFGATFTSDERKALNIEASKIFKEYDEQNTREMDAIVLCVLYKVFGFRKTRLRRMYDAVDAEVRALCKRYDIEDGTGDVAWECTRELLSYGIDLKEWERENLAKKNKEQR